MIVPVTYYTAVCDGCGEDLCEGGEYSAWDDPQMAVESADALLLDGGIVCCYECRRAYRDVVSEVEDDRLECDEFWAVAAFKGWLRWRLAAGEGVFV